MQFISQLRLYMIVGKNGRDTLVAAAVREMV